MFKWPVIVLYALSNLCFFILMISLEGTLSPITKGEFPLTLSSYSCQSKFVRKALKFLTSTEIPESFSGKVRHELRVTRYEFKPTSY